MKASDFRGMPDLGTITGRIEHHEPAFSVSWISQQCEGPGPRRSSSLAHDGRPIDSPYGPRLRLDWADELQRKGRALVSVSADDSGAVHMRGGVRESWDLSPDGRTLTFVREFLGRTGTAEGHFPQAVKGATASDPLPERKRRNTVVAAEPAARR